jgi:hypothetical protein
MKNYENSLSNDTVMGAGLIAIGIAWFVLAALRGPLDADASTAVHAAPAISARAPAGPARTVALPASAQRSAGDKVS